MTNPLNRLVRHPDLLIEVVIENMSEEDIVASFNNPQIIRDLYTQQLNNEADKQTDLDEVRSTKVAQALNSVQNDLADVNTALTAWATMTNAQKIDQIQSLLQREKRALQREQVVIKVLSRLA